MLGRDRANRVEAGKDLPSAAFQLGETWIRNSGIESKTCTTAP
jgi:hypothetical protein